MITIALAGLRNRAAAFLATFLAVALGSSILIACGGLFETALRLDAPPQRYAAVPIVVTGPIGFALPDEESETVPYAERPRLAAGTLTAVTGVAGVARAVPDVGFTAALPTGATVAGHGWASTALGPVAPAAGGAPRRSGEAVVDPSLGVPPGGTLDVVVAGHAERLTVTGVTTTPGLFVTDGDAAHWAPRSDAVDAIGVFPDATTSVDALVERLTSELPGMAVRIGADRGAAEFTGVDASFLPLILLAAVFGGMALVVMALVVSATVGLSVRQRRRELALLRASGATPRQVHRMVVVETMIVSAPATLLGVPLGALLGSGIFAAAAGRGVVPGVLEFRQGIVAFAGGVLVGLAVPLVAAWIAAGAAARTRPIAALAEAAIPQARGSELRRVLALAFAAATVVLAATTLFLGTSAAAVGGPALLTGAIAVGLHGPVLITRAVQLVGGLVGRLAGPAGSLAVINTGARAAMFASVLTPVTLAVAIALGNVYSQTSRDDALVAAYVGQFAADAVVTSPAGVSSEQVAAVRGVSGVAAVSQLVTSRGWIERPYDGAGSDPTTLIGVDAQGPAPLFAVPAAAGSLADLTGATVAVPQGRAEDLGIKVGDRIGLRLGDGAAVDVTVVALLSDGGGSIVVPAALLAPHTSAGAPTDLLVRAAPGADIGPGLSAAVGPWPGTRVGDGQVLAANLRTSVDVEAWINYLLAFLAFAYAAIASVNALVVAVLGRGRELAAQRLAGATRRQVTAMLLVEGGLVAGIGLVLGVAIALVAVVPMAIAAGAVVPSGPAWVLFAVVVAVLAMVGPATLLAGRFALRVRPIDAIARA